MLEMPNTRSARRKYGGGTRTGLDFKEEEEEEEEEDEDSGNCSMLREVELLGGDSPDSAIVSDVDRSSDFSEEPDSMAAAAAPPSFPVASPAPGLWRRPGARRCTSPVPFGGLEEVDEHEELRLHGPCRLRLCPSPPHRKLRALRLFDTPRTPKALLLNVQNNNNNNNKRRRRRTTEKLEANVNPFRLDSARIVAGEKRMRSETESDRLAEISSDDDSEDQPQPKKLALREISTSRYMEEFFEVCKLGDGEFGSVYKCVNRLDGCVYAIKRSKMPIAGSQYERNALNEVYAHAVLGQHNHVVRYYSAWAEDDHMYIQNEFCNGGSLADQLQEERAIGGRLSERELKHIIYQVSQGLKYIHSKGLVHLDIKPGNIFIHRDPIEQEVNSAESGMESCGEDEQEQVVYVTYKIGDLGHVTATQTPPVEEGDCRYLPKEILAENFQHLPKADTFSLGLTAFEVGGGGPLPKNGETWHDIRQGCLPFLHRYSTELNKLLQIMVHPSPECRPSAAMLTQNQVLCPQALKSRSQLRKELNEERLRNRLLSRQLESKHCCCNETQTLKPKPKNPKANRLIGVGMKRSFSLSDI